MNLDEKLIEEKIIRVGDAKKVICKLINIISNQEERIKKLEKQLELEKKMYEMLIQEFKEIESM